MRQDTPVVELIENAPIRIDFDPSHLRRVLTNLLDNALRHSLEQSQQSTARIRVMAASAAEKYYLDIEDDGPGVSEDNLPHLFEPFFTTAQGGSGLGLYLCQDLCQLNRAELSYRSKTAHRPSTFRLTLNALESHE